MKNPNVTYNAAVGAFDALRLFVHNASHTGATFESSASGSGATLREVIQYRAIQCWGELIRTRDGLSLTVIPNFEYKKDFPARRLIFSRIDYAHSIIMTTDPEDYLANDGRDYVMALATLASTSLPSSRLTSFAHEGEHLLVIANTDHGQEAGENAWQLAQSLDLSLGDSSCLLRYPSLDTPAFVAQVDASGGISIPDPVLSPGFAEIVQAASLLPNVLQFKRANDEYPPSYAVAPLAFTIAATQSPAIARALAIGAAARAAVMSGAHDLLKQHHAVVSLPADEFSRIEDAYAAAGAWLLEDWVDVMGDEPKPRIIDQVLAHRDPDLAQLAIQVIVLVDPESAERYNCSGLYDLNR